MPIKINGSTSGSVTLAAPDTGSDVSLTLPTLGFGKVLQVVHSNYSTELSTTSGTAVDTGLSASITPSSTSSKVLVVSNLQFLAQDTSLIWGQILRASSTIVGPSRISNTAIVGSWSIAYLDSPATVSSTTYKVQIYKGTGGGTAVVAQWNSQQTSTLTLIEVGP